MPSEFKSLFKEAVVPEPGVKGDWGATHDGDTSIGQGAAPKGTPGIMPEVTYVDLKDAPGPNEKATIVDIATGAPHDNLGKG